MTRTTTEIAAMIERLNGGKCPRCKGWGEVAYCGEMVSCECRGKYEAPISMKGRREAAAMLREVAAERDALKSDWFAGTVDCDGNDLETIRSDELQHLKDEREKFMWQVRDTCARAEAAEAERDRLAAMVEKLRGYAGHRLDCEAGGNYPFLSEHCTCGVSEVLKESENG